MGVALAFALGCAVSWTLANVTIQGASRRFGAPSALVFALIGGTLLLSVLALLADGVPRLPAGDEWMYLIGAGAAAIVAYGGLFVAMGHGQLAIAAPIISAWSVLALAIGVIFQDEVITTAGGCGIALVIGGNVLLAVSELRGGRKTAAKRDEAGTGRTREVGKDRDRDRGREVEVARADGHQHGKAIPAAIGSAIGFGLLAPLTNAAVDSMGEFWPPPMIWALAAAAGIVILRLTGRLGAAPMRAGDAGAILLPAVFEAAGFFFLVLAMQRAPLAHVAPVSSLATGFTVLVGIGWMRERLTVPAIAGAIAVSVGVVVLQLVVA